LQCIDYFFSPAFAGSADFPSAAFPAGLSPPFSSIRVGTQHGTTFTATVIAVIEFLWDGWRPHSAVLGRIERVKGYHDIARYPEARLIPGLVPFRWDAPLFFANAELFHERVLDAVAKSPTPVRWLVIAAEPVTSVDVTAADAVTELDETLDAASIELCFAEMKDPVKDKLKRFGLFTRFGEQTFFATLGEAVTAYLAIHPVGWIDWEESAKSLLTGNRKS
jgi:MFS superfamily sulfate permease-like transporter